MRHNKWDMTALFRLVLWRLPQWGQTTPELPPHKEHSVHSCHWAMLVSGYTPLYHTGLALQE